MNALAWTLAALCLAALLWVHAGYPALLALRARLAPRLVRSAPNELSLSLILPVRDAESEVEAKLEDVLAQDLPPERLEILLASDGSCDSTVERARAFAPRVRVLDLPARGKAEALNVAAAAATGDILAFSDVSQRFEPGALAALVGTFSDEEVGGACARQLVEVGPDEPGAARGEGLYWRFDQWLKEKESASGSLFASDGGLHAVRRELFVPLAARAQADDMAISMRVVTAGRRLVLAEGARIRESRPAERRASFARRARIVAHSLAAMRHLGRPLLLQGFWTLEVLSHKLMRHLVPLFLLGLALSAGLLALRGDPFASALLALLGLGLGLGLLGLALRDSAAGRARLLAAPAVLLLAHAAALHGIWMVLVDRVPTSWRPSGGGEPGEG